MRRRLLLSLAATALVAAGCETARPIQPDRTTLPQVRIPAGGTAPAEVQDTPSQEEYGWRLEGATPPPAQVSGAVSPERSFSIAFDRAPLTTVVDAVLGESLRRSYRIDPNLQGDLTLTLQGRMSEVEAVASLDRALRSAGAAVVTEGRGYAIVASTDAARLGGPPTVVIDDNLPTGGSALYQARHLGAAEIARLLEPLAGQGATLQVDTAREQLLIVGDPATVTALVRTARSLDTDILQGRSFQFFPVRYASPGEIAEDIRRVLGGIDGPTGGQLQFIELNRLNGLLVVARSPAGLDRAAEWIERFDRSPPPASRRLRSIPLANLEAEQFVTTLSSLLGDGASGSTLPSTADASGPAAAEAEAVGSTAVVGASAAVAGPRLTADPRTNAIILLADDAEYRNVLSIVRELDAPPPQVLIEATIAEVTLNDRLRYGVQWFFDDGRFDGGLSAVTDDSAASSFPGFSLRYVDADVRVVLNALSALTDVQLISTPRILVLSNESAELQVGDQVPIITQTAVGLEETSRVLNSVQYRDTGVVLSVTPRVSESGRMFIQIEQEVSEVAGTNSSDIDSPTIQQRRLSTRIQVEDGQLVVLGGLLRSNRSLGDTGVPGLNRAPIIGALFRTREDTRRQTELVMFLRPTVIRAREDIDNQSAEMVARLQALGLPVESDAIAEP